jgi:hypothetical protein
MLYYAATNYSVTSIYAKRAKEIDESRQNIGFDTWLEADESGERKSGEGNAAR